MTTKLFFKTFGQKSFTPLLILHGWGLSGETFYELAQLLSKNFYVLVPDLPGFGKSKVASQAIRSGGADRGGDGAKDKGVLKIGERGNGGTIFSTPLSAGPIEGEPTEPWTVPHYAKAILSFMSEQDIRSASILGHSFGGQTALVMASINPERVQNLILCGASGVESFNLKRSAKRLMYLVASKLLKYLTFIPAVRRLKDRVYQSRDYSKVEGVMRETFKKVIKERQDEACRKVRCPVYLLWGQTDRLTPMHDADKLNALLPKSKLKIFSNVGHKLPYQKPFEVAREVLTFCLNGGNESGF